MSFAVMARHELLLALLAIPLNIQGGCGAGTPQAATPRSWKLLWLCPMPNPMPASYTVDRGWWSLVDSFTVKVGSEDMGQTARSIFSIGREMRLLTAAGDPWGVSRMGWFSSSLDFFDCVGDLLVRIEADWSWWGGTPSCKILDVDGTLLGRSAVSEQLTSDDTTVVAVEDANGHTAAQLIQRSSWTSVHTTVHILVDSNRMRSNTSMAMDPRVSPLDPLVDLRVLALFSSMRFGASIVFMEGLIFEVGLVLAACVLIRCCMVACGYRRSAAEGTDLASTLERKRDEALQALEQIEADLELERGRCFGQAKCRDRNNTWGLGCCRPVKVCDKRAYLQCDGDK